MFTHLIRFSLTILGQLNLFHGLVLEIWENSETFYEFNDFFFTNAKGVNLKYISRPLKPKIKLFSKYLTKYQNVKIVKSKLKKRKVTKTNIKAMCPKQKREKKTLK